MTRKCEKKGHISWHHPSFLHLALQTLDFARLQHGVGGKGAEKVPAE